MQLRGFLSLSVATAAIVLAFSAACSSEGSTPVPASEAGAATPGDASTGNPFATDDAATGKGGADVMADVCGKNCKPM